MNEEKFCSKCNRILPRSSFALRRKGSPYVQAYCMDCMKPITNQIKTEGNHKNPGRSRENTKRFKKRLQARVDAIKLERGCEEPTCVGYPRNPRALQFDHVRGEKVENVSRMVLMALSWERIEAEIAKCEVVCANCHAIRTAERSNDSALVTNGGDAK